jgi:release factor glutamine methyltransferase
VSVRLIPGLKAGATVAEACEKLADVFRQAGLDEALADARILTGHALSLSRAQLLAQSDRELEPREIDAISARAMRRLRREPVSRIVGFREFWGLKFEINPSVLDPRPDTETVVEAALDWLTTRSLRNERLRVLDIGTGSGALLLSLLSELPNAIGIGTDISMDALATARVNAQRHQLEARCHLVRCNFTAALRGPFELIVSNPPYIASGDIAMLAPEVRDHEPRPALDGGADGLAAYRAIAADSPRLLADGGRLIVELGQGQAEAVGALLRQGGLAVKGPPQRDLSGINRAMIASAP